MALMARTDAVALVADLQMGYAVSARREGKLVLTDGITPSDEEIRGGRAEPICSIAWH